MMVLLTASELALALLHSALNGIAAENASLALHQTKEVALIVLNEKLFVASERDTTDQDDREGRSVRQAREEAGEDGRVGYRSQNKEDQLAGPELLWGVGEDDNQSRKIRTSTVDVDSGDARAVFAKIVFAVKKLVRELG